MMQIWCYLSEQVNCSHPCKMYIAMTKQNLPFQLWLKIWQPNYLLLQLESLWTPKVSILLPIFRTRRQANQWSNLEKSTSQLYLAAKLLASFKSLLFKNPSQADVSIERCMRSKSPLIKLSTIDCVRRCTNIGKRHEAAKTAENAYIDRIYNSVHGSLQWQKCHPKHF